MANIVVTSVGTNGIFVDFGVYASAQLPSPQGFNSGTVVHIAPLGQGAIVTVDGRDSQHWYVSHTSVANEGSIQFMIVDTIDGQAPTDQSDLIQKITALM